MVLAGAAAARHRASSATAVNAAAARQRSSHEGRSGYSRNAASCPMRLQCWTVGRNAIRCLLCCLASRRFPPAKPPGSASSLQPPTDGLLRAVRRRTFRSGVPYSPAPLAATVGAVTLVRWPLPLDQTKFSFCSRVTGALTEPRSTPSLLSRRGHCASFTAEKQCATNNLSLSSSFIQKKYIYIYPSCNLSPFVYHSAAVPRWT